MYDMYLHKNQVIMPSNSYSLHLQNKLEHNWISHHLNKLTRSVIEQSQRAIEGEKIIYFFKNNSFKL